MKKNNRLRNGIRWLIFIFVLIPVLAIVFISPITKYLIEKYDVKYTGREVTVDWVYVNPFTGYVYLDDVKIFELKSDSVFFSSSSVGINFSVYKLFSKNYEISQLTLDQPHTILVQNKTNLNISDIIEKFSGKDKSQKVSEPTHFSILAITLNKGRMDYRETITPVNISISELEIESSGIRWNADTIAAKFSFLSGTGGGELKGDFTINSKNLDYRLAAVIHKLDLNFINQYLQDLSNSGNFRASLDADLKATGNFEDAEDLNAEGKVTVNEFHFGRDTTDDYASFDKLVVDIRQLSPKNHKYLFDSLLLMHPYFKYEHYDYLDNVQTMFGKEGANITAATGNPEKFNLVLEIGRYIKLLSKNFFSSYYQINRLAITEGDMQYNEYALNEKFSLAASPLFVSADSIDKNHKRVEINFKTAIQPYGSAVVSLSINPNDSSDFDMTYSFQKFSLAMFNPYLISYTSFPLDRGTLELNGKWKVRNGFIESNNHLIVIDPRTSKKIRKKDSKWIPVPLAMAFVRERGNVIDYEIPITGNIKNPKFKLKDVILDLIKNIFIKPPTTPYGVEVRNTENEVEKSLNIKWMTRQYILSSDQEKFVKKMSEFLKKNPNSSLNIHPLEFIDKEKEYILFFEAKKKYFLFTHGKNSAALTEKDSIEIDRTPIKDSNFVHYLDKLFSDSLLFTIQQKCYRYIGASLVDKEYAKLVDKREAAFRFYFKQNGTNKQVHFTKTENTIPYNGFSLFVIKYNGEIPEALNEAYQKLQRLNEESPRISYFKLRKKNTGVNGQRKQVPNK